MTVNVSLVLVLGVTVLTLIKFGSLRAGATVVAVLFGFYLASTDSAPAVNDLVTDLTAAVEDIGR
ncbi:hypothetical protein [Streptomyces sp. NPDC054784]